ncbi:MAG: VIT domain-containing protein [Armatimonadota bacterium]
MFGIIRGFRLLTLIAIASSLATADGILLPIRQPTGDVFSVKYHHVDVFINGQAATTKVDQMFHNETSVEEEGTYVFPLPKGATIHKFSMFIGEKEQQGRILDRNEARQLYESIVRRRKDPALLEYMDRNTFQARVYPIPPNGDKRIRLEYTEVVPKTGEQCRYVYPLSTERFSAKPLDDVRITIRLKANVSISNIYSPSHIVSVEQQNPREALITWSAKNVKPDQDLILYYSLGNRSMPLDVMTFSDGKGKGYFMLIATPQVAEESAVLPKNIVFILDRTGSMAGEKIVQAKDALKYCLKSLKTNDHFNVITYNETSDPLWDSLKPASQANIESALKVIDKVDASGGTNLNQALIDALKAYPEKGNANFIVFLTDGLPTVGEQNIETILNNAKSANKAKVRIFAFGVGYDVNAHLLDLLAEQSGGQSEYVLPNESIEAKVSSFYKRIGQPVLTDVRIKTSGVRISEMYPVSPLPDMFRGTQLIVLGRYEGSGLATFTLSGKTAKGLQSWDRQVSMPLHDTERDFITQIWAARKIGYLLDQVRLHRSDELIKEIVQLSKEWGIPTEFTSFFVDEPGAVPLDSAVERASVNLSRARQAESGVWGVNQSINSVGLKSQSQVFSNSPSAAAPGSVSDGGRLGNARGYLDKEGNAVVVSQIQNIGTRTFYQQGNQWVDVQAEDANLKTIQIKKLSDAHFRLLAAYPELSKYQRLGNMRILINNQAVEIGDQGKEELTDEELKAIIGSDKASAPVLISRSGHLLAALGTACLAALLAGATAFLCIVGIR